MLPHISPINTYKGAISSYLLEVLCRGVQDVFAIQLHTGYMLDKCFFLTCKEGLSLTAAELDLILDNHHVLAFFLPGTQPSYCLYILNSLATIKTANHVYYFEYLAKRLQIFNPFIGSTLPTDK
jgi:hypothetical protein